MRKVLLSFLIGCMGFFSADALTVNCPDGGNTNTESGDIDDMDVGRPRYTPRRGPDCFGLAFDPTCHTMYIYTPYSAGKLVAYLFNVTTREAYQYCFNAADDHISFPFRGLDGEWVLTLYGSVPNYTTGFLCDWVFTVDGGELFI